MHLNARKGLIVSWFMLNLSFTDANHYSSPLTAFARSYRGGWIDNGGDLPEAVEDDGTSGLGESQETGDAVPEIVHDTLIDQEQAFREVENLSSASSDRRITTAFLESFLDEHAHDSFAGSAELREKIAEKLFEYREDASERNAIKLIHSIAPKIPAIRHSPDPRLRIRATTLDPDPGIAACLIAAAGTLVESLSPQDRESARKLVSKDRRFEQVCECILCGVNEEYEKGVFEAESWGDDISFENVDESMAETLEQGLTLRDCCRAAYGLSSLCKKESLIGQEQVSSLILVLMRRVCCLLRLEFRRLVTCDVEDHGEMSIDARLSRSCGRLAENTLLSLWSFCKPQFMNTSLTPLVDFGSSILCLDPLDLRKRYQENSESLGANDVVDRLSDESNEGQELDKGQRDVLVDWLSSEAIVDTVHALAFDGSQNSSEDEDNILREICFDRLLHVLLEESTKAKDSEVEQTCVVRETISLGDLKHEEQSALEEENADSAFEVVDATSLLAKEARSIGDSSNEPLDSWQTSFSTLDLCTIAWSATELNASLRSRIVSRILILLTFSSSEQNMLENLPIWALIGAAWAFSKIDQHEDGVSDSTVGNDVLVVGWVVDEIVRRQRLGQDIFRDTPANLLSRLVWSIGVVYDKRVDGTRIATTDASDLIRQILVMASLNDRATGERFLTEDQVRFLLLTRRKLI